MAGRRNDEEPCTTPAPTVTDGYLASGTYLGNYHILKKIGEGGMGVVYAAEHPMHGNVAVKLLSERLSGDEEFKKRFIREIKLMQKISHPNIVGYIGADVDLASGQMYLVTEYVKGMELEKVIRQMGSIPYRHVVGISSQICDALSVIHEAGIVHRDLKPGNIMLLDNETEESGYLAKVLDFGIARFSKDIKQRQSMNFTLLGGVIGTPEYLSPEQAKGEELDHRSDIYSLGIIMYEMLTGKVPFEANTPEKVRIMHATEPPPRIRERYPHVSLPDNLEKVIMFSLNKDPNKRFPSAKDMKNVIQACALIAEMPPEKVAEREVVRHSVPAPPHAAEPVTDDMVVEVISDKTEQTFSKPVRSPKPVQPVPGVELDPKYQRAMKAAGGGKLGETEYIGRDDPRHQNIVGGAAAGEKPFQKPVFGRMPKPAAVAEPFSESAYANAYAAKKPFFTWKVTTLALCAALGLGSLFRYYLNKSDPADAVEASIANKAETRTRKENLIVPPQVQPLEKKLVSCDFVSSPLGAAITYKGSVMGRKTPLKVQGLPYDETLEVKAELEGYETETKVLPAPSSFSLNSVPCQYYFDLKKIAEMVNCSFTTRPSGISIYKIVDGKEELIGESPVQKEFPKGKEIAFLAKAEGYKDHPHTRVIEDPCRLKFTMRKERERERPESLYLKNESEQQARTSDNQEPGEVECLFVTHPPGADIYNSTDRGLERIGRSPMRMNFKRSQREIFSARFEGYNSDSRAEIIEEPCKVEFDLSDMVECVFVTHPSGADIYRNDSLDLKWRPIGRSPMHMNFKRFNREGFFARLEGYTDKSRVARIEHPCKIEFDMESVRSAPSHLVNPLIER